MIHPQLLSRNEKEGDFGTKSIVTGIKKGYTKSAMTLETTNSLRRRSSLTKGLKPTYLGSGLIIKSNAKYRPQSTLNLKK